MKFSAGLLLFFLLFPYTANAASCKVDGLWYPYDSPQCNPQEAKEEKQDASSDEQTQNQQPDLANLETISNEPGSYLLPWAQVSANATMRCKSQPNDLMINNCRRLEEIGYWAMHGNFDLPEDQLSIAKERCMAKTGSFESQSICMQNESNGYVKFMRDFEMPDEVLNEARAKCTEQYEFFSNKGLCMISAAKKYQTKDNSVLENSIRNYTRVYAKAEGGKREIPAGYTLKSEVFVLNVDPGLEPAMRHAYPPEPPPSPLDAVKTRNILNTIQENTATNDESGSEVQEYFTLSTSQPFIKDKASLSFAYPRHLTSTYGASIGEKDESSVTLVLNVEEGKRYLVDFVVMSVKPISYRVAVKEREHIYEDIAGTYRHILVELLAASSGRAALRLGSEHGEYFQFYSVGVTATGQN